MNQQNSTEFHSALESAVKEVPFSPDTITEDELKKINDNRMALWRTEQFKNSLRKAVRETLKKEKEKVPNKYASRVYRQMYFKNVRDSNKFKKYEKIQLHPDITKSDYYYIEDKISSINTNVKISSGVTLASIAYLIIRKDLIGVMMKSPGISVPIVGLIPFGGMLTAQYLTEFFLNKKLNDIGLFQKYQLQDLY
ncbi:hypothetical protein ABPG72_010798 [Tetrahymena utriculariae]